MKEQIAFYKNVTGKKAEMIELLRILQDEKMMKSYCRRKLVHLYLNNLINRKNGNNHGKNQEEVHEI